MKNFDHVTVLKKELVEALNLSSGSTCIDATLGGGGHTELLFQTVGPSGRVFAFDRDENAIAFAKERLKPYSDQTPFKIFHAPFSDISRIYQSDLKGQTIHGICADIGVSSPQLDHGDRGFSFRSDGPLDMRMDQSSGQTAADLINDLSIDELSAMFKNLGEEPKGYHYAQVIKKRQLEKPFTTTLDLATFIEQNNPYKKPSKKHPATKIFQALRIVVNDELGELKTFIQGAFEALTQGGRLAIISFHSLEDRIVKNEFKTLAGKAKKQGDQLKGLPISNDEYNNLIGVRGKIIKPFPIIPSDDEIKLNPRSRSAKLRVIEKL